MHLHGKVSGSMQLLAQKNSVGIFLISDDGETKVSPISLLSVFVDMFFQQFLKLSPNQSLKKSHFECFAPLQSDWAVLIKLEDPQKNEEKN